MTKKGLDNENQLAVGIKNINRHFADYYELFRKSGHCPAP